MARAKYFDGNDYKNWTADMVGGLALNGTLNNYINISSPSNNATGYYLVAEKTFSLAWENSRALWMINSRHIGTGIVSIEAGSYSKKPTCTQVLVCLPQKKNFLHQILSV